MAQRLDGIKRGVGNAHPTRHMYVYTFYTLMSIFIFVCLFMILLVLIQKGRGGGLASAFGGAGSNTAFGSKTGDVLTWVTSVTFAVFVSLAVTLNLMANHWPTK
jgi:preprotein translocase subunit SecG